MQARGHDSETGMLRRTLVSFVAAVLVLGCGDETTINNYNLTNSGIIWGSINPIDVSTFVRLDSLRVFVIAEDGKFVFTDVPPGEHVITVEPPNYSRRRISQIEVWPSQVYNLKGIELSNLPYPVYETYPADGDTGILTSKSYGIELEADESLDTADLNAKTTIVPSLEGIWHGKSDTNRTRSSYAFYRDEPSSQPDWQRPSRLGRVFRVGTTYNVRIDGAVRTALGVPLGRDIEINFTTEPLNVNVSIPADGLEGGVRLSAFIPTVTFNDSVNIDSLAKAVTFIPAIEGIWLAKDQDYALSFLPSSGPLPPATTFRLIVSDQVPLSGVARLGKPDTTMFTTEPIGVTYINPCDGCSGYGIISLEFNAPMNHQSVESAFSLTSADGGEIEGIFRWYSYDRPDRRVSFEPTPPLSSGEIYKATLSTDAHSADGYPIYKEVVSNFLAN